MSIEAITLEIRHAMSSAHITPSDFAVWLQLELVPVSGGVPGLRNGNRLTYDDEASPEIQASQIARGACAFALAHMGFLYDVKPHELAVALFGEAIDAQQRAHA